MNLFLIVCMVVLANSVICLAEGTDTPNLLNSNPNILVGACYFPGWWEPLPNKWRDNEGRDWRERYPERIPLLGAFNTQEVMDQEIIAAAAHGIDFFAILWYFNPKNEERETNARFLSRGVETFMASKEAYRMKFMLEFCNHPPFEVVSDEAWEECVSFWASCMTHPSYLMIHGKPIFKVHGGHYFLIQNNNDLHQCKERLHRLRQAARDVGFPEIIIGCGVSAHETVGEGHFALELFDFTCTYMDVPNLPKKADAHPFEELDSYITAGRMKHVADKIPYMPFVAVGWSPDPWNDPRPSFSFPTKKEWKNTLLRVKKDLLDHEQLGLPCAKAFTIYAWNEFGEGGILAPTQKEQYSRLAVVKEVFMGKD